MRQAGRTTQAIGARAGEPGAALPRRWTGERIARLAFLAGVGWTAKRVAADPLVASTPAAVYRAAARYGIAFGDAPQGQLVLRLPPTTLTVVEGAARTRGITPATLVRYLVIVEARRREPFAGVLV